MEIIKSGLNRLDKKLNGGFRKGSLAVIAGWPGMGKTAFALQIAGNITKNGYNVILFSLEMSKDTVLERMAKQGVDKECHIIIDDTPAISVESIADKAKCCENIDVIIIDYFQLLKCNETDNYDNRSDEAICISNALKNLAKEMNVSVIVTSQISRPSVGCVETKPSLLDFRDSRRIVKYADIILFTYLEAFYPEHPNTYRKDKLIIAKNNFGYTGYVEVRWNGIKLSFIENKIYELEKDVFYPMSEEEAAKFGCREVPAEEQNDISFLVNDEFVSYFTARPPECKGTTTGYMGSWNYPDIMWEFLYKVERAYAAIHQFSRSISDKQSFWTEIRVKYCNGSSYVLTDEMIKHLSEFNNKEIVAFLWYCSNYEERFCDGSYGFYAAEGFIGKLLVRLKELPLYIT